MTALTRSQWTANFRVRMLIPVKAAVHWGEAWLRVGAIIAEFNISGYGVAR